MGLLDNIKDENGQIKKPILFSLVGATGLVGYMMLSNRGQPAVIASGASSGLTPDLSALADALKGLTGQPSSGGSTGNGGGGGSGGGSGSSPSGDPPVTTPPTTSTDPTPTTRVLLYPNLLLHIHHLLTHTYHLLPPLVAV